MKVFISWSGTLSHKVALILRDWLPSVLQSLQPYVSSEDIDKGTRWSTDISKELEQSAYGILCVTKDNLEASWLNFEAGALSKAFDKSRVSPFLIGVKRAEIKGPILQFQSTIIEKDDIKKLLHSLNKACDLNSLEEVRLDSIFDVWWPKLNEKLDSVIQEYKIEEKSPQEDKKIKSTINNEMIEEILELVRSQQKILKNPETLFPPDYINYILRHSKEINPFISKAVEDIFLRYRDLREYLSSCKDLGELSLPELIDKVEMLGRPLEVIIHNSDNRMNFRLRKLVK